MKKFLFIILLILFPLKCFALSEISIYDTTLRGPSSVKEGESFTIEIGGVYAGLDQNSYDVQGIFEAGAEFEFDDSVLEITEAYTDYYDSIVAKIDGKYYVYGTADESENNKCADKFLDCTPYSARIVFFVKDTDAKEVKIKLNELALGVFNVRSDREYYEDDMQEVSSTKSKEITIKIEQTNEKFEVPESVVKDSIPTMDNDTLQSALKNNNNEALSEDEATGDKKEDNSNDKEDNKFLKSLSIKGQKIDFKENKSTYQITLPDRVNKLVVNAIPYVSDAIVKIVGADDLKSYSDIVKVRVELPNHEKMTYVINIKRESLSAAESNSIINKLNYVGFGILGFVLFIVVIVLISNSRDKRKLRKLLENE